MQVALPPLDLQHHFAAIAESVEHQKAANELTSRNSTPLRLPTIPRLRGDL